MEKFQTYLNDNVPWLTHTFADVPYWAWMALPLGLIVAYGLGAAISAIALGGLRAAFSKVRMLTPDSLLQFRAPGRIFLTGLIFSAIVGLLPLEKGLSTAPTGLGMLITVLGVTWMLLRLITIGGARMRTVLVEHGKIGAAALLPLLDKIMRVLVIALAFLFILQNFGFDVVAIITALGIGGIAVALASQKSVENVFGGAMLSLDQPVRVGDFCRWRDQVGTVEDIGLRSTKIRTLDRTIVAIPNADLASIQLENFTARDKILLSTVLGLRYETTAEQIRYIVSEIHKMLVAHSEVEDDPARARFVGFGDYSLDIELFAYVKTSDWGKFLEIREDILLRIMAIVADAGSDFAYPSQTLYFERGSSLSRDRQEDIARKMAERRERGELDWPDISPEKRSRLSGTLIYQSN